MADGAERAARPISAAAVARAANVSPATVSYVMNGRAGVSQKTRRMIIELASEMGYKMPSGARGEIPTRNNVVGLVVPNMINPMFPRWAHGVAERARQTDQEVFLSSTDDMPDILEDTVRALIARRVDGLIITAVPREEVNALQLLRAARVPYVQLSRKSDFVPGSFVGIDDAAAAVTIMGHVLDHGPQRIAIVVGPRYSSASAARERSMVLAAENRGVEVPPAWRISTRLNNQGGRLAAQRLLSETPVPDAIVCGSDELAIGVMEYLLKAGFRVPQDILVTGFDGLPHSRSELVGLTTIVQPQIEMAQAAFDMLQERVKRPSAPFESRILPHDVWYGRSCGCPEERQSKAPDAPVSPGQFKN